MVARGEPKWKQGEAPGKAQLTLLLLSADSGPCLEHQLAFERSCYEIVQLERSFQDAQKWCERGGGHIAFILNEETQEFIKKHLAADKDWWIGLAPWKQNLTHDEMATDVLAWLDGTNITYNNWSPEHQSSSAVTCAYILKNSGHHWMGTTNCNQEFYFICELESDRAFACDHFNATLQCPSGNVIEIDSGFYGRKSLAYCSAEIVAPTESEECSWIDVKEEVAGQCQGLQACQSTADQASFGNLCPRLGNYLVIDYHCKEGLLLLVDDMYSILENVTISPNWLLHPYSGNLTCTLNTGDGFVIDPYNPLLPSSDVTHRYMTPGLFTINVECTTSEWHVAAQKTVSIQQPISGFGIIKCCNVNQSEDNNDCSVLYGDPLWIQLEVEEGTDVTYVVRAGAVVLHTFTVFRGSRPQNVTIEGAAQLQIGPGIHQLTILAKNNVTTHELSQNITVQLVEPIKDLQATVNSAVLELGNDLTVNISVSSGAPIELQFEFIGPKETFSEAIEIPDGNVGAYSIPMNSEGTILVRGNAINAVSRVSFNVGNITVVANTSNQIHRDMDDGAALLNEKEDQAKLSPTKSLLKGDPDEKLQFESFQAKINGGQLEVANPFSQLVLSGRKSKHHIMDDHSEMTFQWSCGVCWPLWDICVQNNQIVTAYQDLTIHPSCLPPPNSFISIKLTVSKPDTLNSTAEKCLIFTKKSKTGMDIRCKNNCSPVDISKSVTLTVDCQDCKNPVKYNWYRVNPSKHQINLPPACNIKQQNIARESLTLVRENTAVLVLGKEDLVNFAPVLKVRAVGISDSGDYKYKDYIVSMMPPLPELSCNVFPREGSTVTTKFSAKCTIACSSNSSCNSSDLTYCFFVKPDVPLHCESQPILPPTYLPLGDTKNDNHLNITVTVRNSVGSITSVITTVVVREFSNAGNAKDLATLLSENLEDISNSITNSSLLIQLFESVSSELNQEASEGIMGKLALEDKKQVGPLTTMHSTQCLCNHLTFFSSSFLVMPNAVDVSKTAELFATFVDNPVVVTTVACIFGLYILAVVWARRKDKQDMTKAKITLLADNDPFAQYRYLVTVFTGHRRGASTTSKVTITLYGSEGESDPHFLTDLEKPNFERGGVDGFLLTTLFPLGDLQRIRLWHDNSGSSPSWYVNRVTVLDLETDERWCFLCNSWLAIDVGDCLLDKAFPVATEMDLKRFSNLFFMKTAKDFRDGHIWYSVLNRPPRSPFTRVQRVSCCFSLLLCTMLTSIIFWGVPKDPAEQKMDLGKIEFTWQQVVIGFESSLLMFPINLLIVQIFRNIRPRSKGRHTERKQGKHGRISPSLPASSQSLQTCSLTPEAVIKDIQRIANSLTKTLKNPLPTLDKDLRQTTDINKLLALVESIIREQNKINSEFYNESRKKEDTVILSLGSVDLQEHTTSSDSEKGVMDKQRRSDYNRYLYLQLQHVENELDFLGSSKFHNPQSYTRAVRQVHHMKDLLENAILCSNSVSERFSPTPSLSEDNKKGHCSKGLPWWFVFVGWALVAVTSGVSAFFTMLYGLHYGKDSSIKWLISMAISFFESVLITQPLKVLGFAAFFALVLKKVEQEDDAEGPIDSTLSTSGDSNALLATRRDSSSNIYQPPPQIEVEHMKKNSIKEQKVFGLIREILAYLGFLWMLLLVAYGQRDPNSYYLNKAIETSFTSGFDDILSYNDFFQWANSTLITNLFGFYPGFVTDGNSKLVGSARIRQLRIKNNICRIPRKLRSSIKECHALYSLDNEDISDYSLHWNASVSQNSSDLDYVWKYQSQTELRGYPIWGKLAMYRGGGYIAELGTDAQDAYRVLKYLFDNTWLDTYTRAIFVEFTVYNANVNLFCIATLILESNAVGAFFTHSTLQSIRLYQYTDGLHIFVVAAEVAYFLFLIYYMVIQGKLLREQKWNYFKSKWNLLETAIIMISWSTLSVFIKRTILGNRDIEHYHSHRKGFVSFYETAMADAIMGYLIAFLVLLATIKLWHLLRINPKLNMITSTLRRAWGDISGFLIVILIMFLAYSIATNIMFGWSMSSYKTIFDAAETMVSLQLGIFNYEEVLDYNPILGSFLIGSCIVFMTFVVLNLFISVILVAFSEEQKNYKASEEEEIVDLMLTKLCSFLGIKNKKGSSQSGD
ncbi:polycystic kidney disease protein 1-like 2 [Rhincodon typus]|uniref:polycystic kidney disease protein 1-like 2 n=1 Tax=Rhincodon typus TaxID=259920 RepID=UPI002030B861|nr:polycystic kidney disease protein 1-like 2 [Rhincodon typus]